MQALGLGNLVDSGSLFGNVGPAISLPIFQGGALKAQYGGAWAAYDEAVANYNQTVVTAFQQVADAVTQRDAADKRLAAARTALTASEARFRELAENTEDVFYSRDASTGQLLYISPACERLTGRESQNFYDKPDRYLATVHPDDLEAVKAAVEASLCGLTTEVECRLIKPSGEMVWVRHFMHLVDGRVADLHPHVAPLSGLTSKHGTFFVTGNHEYYSGAHDWIAELRRLGLPLGHIGA